MLVLISLTGLPAHGQAQGGPTPDAALDRLYDRLAKAQTDKEAENIAIAIQRSQLHSGSDTADLLMDRALTALQASQANKAMTDKAIRLLSAVIHLRPQYAEAWNKRATAYYLKNDYVRSIADIAQTLSRNPREYGAWNGLGMMLIEIGDKKHGYEALQKALAINPHQPETRKALDKLKDEIEGRDI